MGKTGKAAKRRKLEHLAAAATTHSPPEDDDSSPDFLLGLISPSELAIAAQTLKTLSTHPELLTSAKADLRGLRGAVYDFHREAAAIAGTGNSLTSRISAALADSRLTDAQVLLAELRIRQVSPKLGALQRWVRDCDAASRSDGSFGDAQVLKVLDAILRCTAGDDQHREPAGPGEGVVRKLDAWRMRSPSGKNTYADVQAGTLPAPADRSAFAARFSLLDETPGADRLPPNHHPALLFATSPSAISLSASPSAKTSRHEVPNVAGAFLLADALSLEECREIVASAEAVGFLPDQPIGDEGASVLAHNLYWLADEGFLGTFWARIKEHLPQEVAGGKVQGLNARFRVYRYVPGAIYRPHIDGAWPKSGVDPKTGKYLYDSSPPTAPQWSRLTFLIYLNDEFDQGSTTFFLPSTSDGVLNAYPVKPLAGCALVFPHGDTKGSLLHEGSPVGTGGAKYVIRTEVLYSVGKQGASEAEF